MNSNAIMELPAAPQGTTISCAQTCEIRVLRSMEELEQIRDQWGSMEWNPELDLDYVAFIVKARQEVIRPLVIAIWRDGKPVSLLAGRLETGDFQTKLGYKVLWRFKVRQVGIFYGGLMGESSPETIEMVLRHLPKLLREEKADLLYWSGVKSGTELYRKIRTVPGLLCRDHLSRPELHWVMTLPGSLEELLEKRMNKKHRYWAKRTMRALEKDFEKAVHLECFSTPETTDRFFAEAIKVARKAYLWNLGLGFKDNEEHRQWLKLLSEKKWLRGYVLYVKDEPIAFWICLIYKGTAYSAFTGYDSAYKKYEVGTGLFLRMIGELCNQGAQRLDFGLGTALYKERFGDSSFEETTFCIFAPTGRGIFLNLLRLLTEGPVQLARGALRRLNLEQKIKTAWRSRAVSKKDPTPESNE